MVRSYGVSNGLLTGLTEAWLPDATKAMIGQKTGLNTNTDAGLSYVVQAGFPGGHALQSGAEITLQTAASALLQAIGATDFLYLYWSLVTADFDGDLPNSIGEGNNNGFDVRAATMGSVAPADCNWEMPGADGNYTPQLATTGAPYSAATAHMVAIWYTTADSTMHLQVDGNAPVTAVNSAGIGAPDATNTMAFPWRAGAAGSAQQGFASLWQGTAGVANAVSKLSTLRTSKLQYSDFT